MTLAPLPPGYVEHRQAVHRVAVHVLSRARSQAVGRIGLVPTPGGLGTPAFGPDHTVVRLTPTTLVVEQGPAVRMEPLTGATLRSLASLAGADLAAPLGVGSDTPPVGDPDARLALEGSTITLLASWHALAWQLLDQVVATLSPGARPARTQLWPEHFDSATSVQTGRDEGSGVGLGASSGDGFHPAPYLYVGPWGPERPGDPAFWNAPFGAVLRYEDLAAATSPLAEAATFFDRGLALAL
ncbi:MAG: hypothetical protein JWM47_803 [Acidimicrobiales bacterium]|nr:hypothetical protein [Acidimicrobiales bacterium]